MIELILKSYYIIFLAVGIGCLSIFILGLYWIFSPSSSPLQVVNELSAIAGDDVFSTQLDLARAYIEMNNKLMAKKILKAVIDQGSKIQRDEAELLLGLT